MTTVEVMDRFQHEARKNPVLKEALIETKTQADPLAAFCRVARAHGFELYPMDVVCAGEEFHAAMKRSTNGGGENSPKLDGQDDFYELFMAEIEK